MSWLTEIDTGGLSCEILCDGVERTWSGIRGLEPVLGEGTLDGSVEPFIRRISVFPPDPPVGIGGGLDPWLSTFVVER